MRPRLEGVIESQIIELVTSQYPNLTPTQLLQKLVDEHYHTLYPRGKDTVNNAKIEEDKTSNPQ